MRRVDGEGHFIPRRVYSEMIKHLYSMITRDSIMADPLSITASIVCRALAFEHGPEVSQPEYGGVFPKTIFLIFLVATSLPSASTTTIYHDVVQL